MAIFGWIRFRRLFLLLSYTTLTNGRGLERHNANCYDQRFRGSAVTPPTVRPDCISIYNQYVIRVQYRDAVIRHLKECNVSTEIYYPLALHQQECFRNLWDRPQDCPNAVAAAAQTLALPVYPELTNEMLQYVSDAVLSLCR